MVEKDVTGDTCFVVARAEKNVAAILACVFIKRVTIIQGQLSATIVFIELDVYHAGNCVRSESGGSAIFQNFDALNGCDRNGIQIEEGGAGDGGPRVGATRRPSIRTSVAPGPKPRRETEAAPAGPPAPVGLF